MEVATILFSVIFFVLFIFALFLISMIYVCDTYECKPFTVAETKAPPGSQEYVLILLSEFFNDGIWVFPFIGAAISTLLTLLLLGIPMTIKNFTIMFLVVFIVTYFLFSFFGHHYIKPLTDYTSEYIINNCPSISSVGNAPIQNLSIQKSELDTDKLVNDEELNICIHIEE